MMTKNDESRKKSSKRCEIATLNIMTEYSFDTYLQANCLFATVVSTTLYKLEGVELINKE